MSIKSSAQGAVFVDLDTISAYAPSWENEAETFEGYDFSTVEVSKGRRFSLNITTGALSMTELNTIKTALITRQVTVKCPEYPSGKLMAVTSVNQEQASASLYGKYYRLSMSMTAISVETGAFNEVTDSVATV